MNHREEGSNTGNKYPGVGLAFSPSVISFPRNFFSLLVYLMAVTCVAIAQSYAIPAESLDEQKIFWGNPAAFSKPAEVDFKTAVLATEEYKTIRKEKVQPGTGRYWILISQASERAIRAISAAGKEQGFDLVVAKGYLESVNIQANPPDITESVLKKLSAE